MAYDAIVRGGGVLTQPFGCSSWACDNHSEWNCPQCRCGFAFHAGIDVAARPGTELLAAGYGDVVAIGRPGGLLGCGGSSSCGGLGPYAPGIRSGNVIIWYGHAQRCLVTRGQRVVPGMPVALMGTYGCSTGTHVHFEVDPVGACSGCQALNPNSYLSSWPGSSAPPPGPGPTPEPSPSPASSAMLWLAAGAAAITLYAARR